MDRPRHRRQRFSQAQYQPAVQRVVAGRILSASSEIVTSEMVEASIAVYGLLNASGPKVRERIKQAMVTASIYREWDVQDELVKSAGGPLYEY